MINPQRVEANIQLEIFIKLNVNGLEKKTTHSITERKTASNNPSNNKLIKLILKIPKQFLFLSNIQRPKCPFGASSGVKKGSSVAILERHFFVFASQTRSSVGDS